MFYQRPPAGPYSPPRHYHAHSDSHPRPRPRQHSHSHSPPYAHAQPALVQVQMQVPMQVPMYHSSQSRSRRRSTGVGPLVADHHISRNPTLAYSLHTHFDPRCTQTKGILKNWEGLPPAPAVSYCHRMGTHRVVLTYISHSSRFDLTNIEHLSSLTTLVGGIRPYHPQLDGFELNQDRPYALSKLEIRESTIYDFLIPVLMCTPLVTTACCVPQSLCSFQACMFYVVASNLSNVHSTNTLIGKLLKPKSF